MQYLFYFGGAINCPTAKMKTANRLVTILKLTSFLFIFWNSPIIAQNQNLRFQKLEAKNVPLFPVVECMLQDSRGFFWIGSYSGLYRYDGYEFNHFQNIPNDSLSISDNKINGLVENQKGNLWVGTQNGLNFFDVKKETFKSYTVASQNGIGAIEINDLIIDRKGVLWLATVNGVFYKNPNQDIFYKISRNPKNENDIGDNIYSILEDNENTIWVLDNYGLSKIEKQSNEIINVVLFKDQFTKNFFPSNLMTEGNNLILISTSEGLYCYDKNNKAFEIHPVLGKLLKSTLVGDFTKFQNQIWISHTNGLLEYYPKTKTYTNHIYELNNPYSLPESSVYKNKISLPNTIWTFNFNERIRTANFQKREFFQMLPHDLYEAITHVRQYYEIYEFEKKHILIPKKEGARLLNFETGEIVPFPYQPTYNLEGWKSGVICFHEEKNGLLWIGTRKGIFLFDKKKMRFLPFENNINGINSLRSNNIRKIHRDKRGNLWVATWGNGVCKINFEKNEFIRYEDVLGKINLYTTGVRTIFEDSFDNIWIGTRGGLLKYLPESDDFLAYLHDEKDGKSISENTAFSIYEDKKGILWIGTYGGGLNKFDPQTGKFLLYSTKDGLLNNNVFSIIPDAQENLWLMSYDGLTKFNPEKITFQNFTSTNGLINDNFDAFMFGKSRYSEQLFFGGKSGLDIIHPDKIEYSKFEPNVWITDLKLFNESVPFRKQSTGGKDGYQLEQHISFEKEINLNYDQNVVSFDYVALDFSSPENIQYAYLLEGFDKDWQHVGNKRSVTFTNLKSGTYHFKVKATNGDGIWGSKIANLKIIVNPPWWNTWWAYLLYATSIGTLIWVYLQYQRRRYFLQAQLELEHQEAERLKALDTLKTNLYTNITHEFRTPLTVILGLSNLIKEQMPEISQEKITTYLHTINRNGEGLLNLVNQMLDLSKIEVGKLNLNLVQGNLLQYLKYLSDSYHSFAESKNIQIHFISPQEKLLMDYDPERIRQIFSNLVSNATKFTPQGGHIYILVEIQEEEQKFILKVKDTGIGIDPKQVDYIFDRFYQVEDSSTRKGEGTGIGLALTKELVGLMDGTISVESVKGEGTTFEIILPIERSAKLIEVNLVKENAKGWTAIPLAKNEEASILNDQSDQPLLLLIEDNTDVRTFLKISLEENYQIIEAVNGQLGIDLAIEKIPDIIISDVMMPEKDGFEVCQKLKTDDRTSHIPIILLTAKADIDSKIQGLEYGADAYLPKPFDRQELLVRIRKLIELRTKLQNRYQDLSNPIPQSNPLLEKEDAFVTQVRELIEVRMEDTSFGVAEISKEIFKSRTQVHRKLKALTGLATGEFIHHVKLYHALHLIQSTDKSITEIAFDCGYNELAYFSKLFSKKFGDNPSSFRK
ncbi:MAG: two-component regulator propeller domain-containing protein [Saprospiraceae bacterium]